MSWLEGYWQWARYSGILAVQDGAGSGNRASAAYLMGGYT